MTYDIKCSALGDNTRRAVFERLRAGPCAVGEIARHLPVSRPAVSQHLRVLKMAGLVRERRQGTRRLYEVDLDGLEQVRSYLNTFRQDVLDAFADSADSTHGKDRHGDDRG